MRYERLAVGADGDVDGARIRSMAQKRFTAVGRVAAISSQMAEKPASKPSRGSWRAPSASPIAAVTPMAGAPRTIIVRMDSATPAAVS